MPTAQANLAAGPDLVAGPGDAAGFGEAAPARSNSGTLAVNLTSVLGAGGLKAFGNTCTALTIHADGFLSFAAGSTVATSWRSTAPSAATPSSSPPT